MGFSNFATGPIFHGGLSDALPSPWLKLSLAALTEFDFYFGCAVLCRLGLLLDPTRRLIYDNKAKCQYG